MPGAAYMVSSMSSISLREGGVDLRDGLRPRAQARVGKFQNWKQRHGGKIRSFAQLNMASRMSTLEAN